MYLSYKMKFLKAAVYALTFVQLLFGHGYSESNVGRDSHNKSQFYQDLTEPIDKILLEGNASYQEVLKNAISFSPYVFYESDMLLNDISNILPVIDLLVKLKPVGINPQLMLSLRYVNETSQSFLSSRMADAYYNLKCNLSMGEVAKIVNHVAAITLNFRSSRYDDSDFYQHESTSISKTFTRLVKNFVDLNFGKNAIPVGVLYGNEQHMAYYYNVHYHYLKKQIRSADFVIFFVEFQLNFHTGFPMFIEEFNTTIRYKLNVNRDFVNQWKGNRNIEPLIMIKLVLGNEIKNVNEDSLYPYYTHGDYWNMFYRVMKETSEFNSTAKQTLQKACSKSQNIFAKVVTKWASLEEQDIIISNFHANFTDLSSTTGVPKEDPVRLSSIIPVMHADEESVNICDLKANLSNWRNLYESVLVDEETWRTIARYQQELEDESFICNGTIYSKAATLPPFKAMLNFQVGISAIWKDVGTLMTELVHLYPNLAEISLTTLTFSETDIISSKEIQQFLNTTKFEAGCILSFNNLRRIFGEPFNSNTFKSTIEKTVCQPVFPSVKTFIWQVSDERIYYGDNINFLRNALISSYSDVFLARKVFLKEFPDKKVIIYFDSMLNKEIIASMYDVPIISNFVGPSALLK